LDNNAILIILLILAVALGVFAWWYIQKRRSDELQSRFGPEYDRAIESSGSRRTAEEELRQREKRIERLELRELTPNQRGRFAGEWSNVQEHFVDDPSTSVREADVLVLRVMHDRGYPSGDFEQRAADISVDHPQVVENYRSAHEIVLRSDRGEASTEDLRQAMVHFRSLFADLLESEDDDREVRRERIA
jgi:hypothetical protein